MRVLIIGPSGSGKSYLARKLSQIYQAPHIELDKIWLKYGGRSLYRTKPDELIAEKDSLRDNILGEVKSLTKGKDWVVDGNYSYVRDALLDKADRVILINFTKSTAIGNLIKRQLRGENRRRGYNLSDFVFHLPRALKNHSRSSQKLQQSIASHKDVVVLTDKTEINSYIAFERHNRDNIKP
ncbi:hypothetical protein EPO04_04230 [Patescibacteria group bacterium]|nr:MAG: hypothetical protein EPO04_04230 [Patescibacteria group bacterium]